MASSSYPRLNQTVGELLYERLAAPQAPDGLLGLASGPPLVYANGVGDRTVRLRADRRALVRGFVWDSGPTDIQIQLPANTSGATRTDLIVLRLNRNTWQVQETYVQGAPGAGAPQPSLGEGDIGVYDLPVASVTIPHNAAGLPADAVTPLGWYVNADGLIVCTPTTRPPGSAGRIIHEYTTDKWWLSPGTGEKWLPVSGGLSGRALVSFSNKQSHTQAVSFGYTFPAAPHVTTEINSGAGETARWGSRAIGITTTGFTLFVYSGGPTFVDTDWSSVSVSWQAEI